MAERRAKLLIAEVAPSASRVTKSAYSVRSWPSSSVHSLLTMVPNFAPR